MDGVSTVLPLLESERRDRIAVLEKQLDALALLQARAEAKGSTLLALAGGAAGIAAAVLAGSRTEQLAVGSDVALWIGWAGAGILSVATMLLVMAVRPERIFHGPKERRPTLRFANLETPEAVIREVDEYLVDVEKHEKRLAGFCIAVGRSVNKKFRLILTATNLLLVGLLTLVVAALVHFTLSRL